VSAGRPLRVALISELPTPYRWPVFRRLLEREDLDLRVLFCARTERDRDFRFDFRPDERVRFLPVTTLSFSGRRTVHYHVNHTIFGELARGRYDVVVLPGYAMFASQAGALWCRGTGTPYVMFSETTDLDRRPGLLRTLKRALLPTLVGGASAWLPTGKLSQAYLAAFGAREEDMFPFPNTPDVESFRAAAARGAAGREELRADLGAGDRPVALFVGRLIGVKRLDLLLDALARVRAGGVDAACWVAGDGVERPALEDRAASLEGVRFLGNVPSADLPALYSAADVFVLPSDHEPWGAVVCEAMACSLPVVVSDRVGSGPDLVVEGENGAVFPHGDAAALAGVLGRLLSDPGGLRRMGARSGRVISRFTHGECVKSFLGAVERAFRRGKKGCPTVGS
jgi:glycosyltransferase involved in cell wall biosynthesis